MLVKNVSYALVLAFAFSMAPVAQAHVPLTPKVPADVAAHVCSLNCNKALKLVAGTALLASVIYTMVFKKPVAHPEDTTYCNWVENFYKNWICGQIEDKKDDYEIVYDANGQVKKIKRIKYPATGFIGKSLKMASTLVPAAGIALLLINNMNLLGLALPHHVENSVSSAATVVKAVGANLKAS